MIVTDEKITKKPRKYFKEEINLNDWNEVKKVLEDLLSTEIKSKDELIEFLEKWSELESIISEEMAWRYIKMTCDTKEENSKAFNEFYANIVSPAQEYDFKLKKKFYDSPYRNELTGESFEHMNRLISRDIELFRKENLPLMVKEQELGSKYGEIISKITVTFDGEEKTLSQMGVYLKNPDRKVREEAWRLTMNAVAEHHEELEKLFDELKEIRIKIAKNAGYDNYRDYMHDAKKRFDFTPEDLYEFHKSVEEVVVPALKKLNEERKEKLGVESLRPWDTEVDVDGKVLKPFDNVEEFIDNAIKILSKVDIEFAKNLEKMKNTGFLDLENRKGKAPGGYNYPLSETGAAFIFMNAVGLSGDVRTLLHESGHAQHTFRSKDISISFLKDFPSEIAELASMSMELLTLEYLDEYYKNEEDLKKAKREQLESTLKILPWVMIVDAFQHWIYTNPDHTIEERDEYFGSLMDRFNTGIDWSGLDKEKRIRWLRQLHIFEVPFYYIEYAMSQLGAIAVYKNYKENGQKAIEQYKEFLSSGYKYPVKKLYEIAGIKFDFSKEYIKELTDFIISEIEKVK
ncbi:oligoendopeptidase F [Marinitoga sp. 1135]|uniref:Oligoendopeptidase, M3 family n=1 Tax=Marinitoga piezophila (strain DSM 14283 / JCM 11233 / KA3) TaxID=443254 RepID=H2J755_MARPK|nr:MULTISPECIES: M3 family oligoendopeptidase [Marinitoga]AEX86425.1 oligoendopeptidase, M3 family [Marinitoga piezophila KA3]APT76813.1 oligoendopeptidase F [Marinitoga sp. 1137]NUU96581.1 oligoendopeptidase F [Marinitoga sp. 1135]